jgi:hypothetical protein
MFSLDGPPTLTEPAPGGGGVNASIRTVASPPSLNWVATFNRKWVLVAVVMMIVAGGTAITFLGTQGGALNTVSAPAPALTAPAQPPQGADQAAGQSAAPESNSNTSAPAVAGQQNANRDGASEAVAKKNANQAKNAEATAKKNANTSSGGETRNGIREQTEDEERRVRARRARRARARRLKN